MERLTCQSCGMPMEKEELLGTEADGVKSTDYCVYCYTGGAFKKPDETMEEMIETCIPFMKEAGMPEEEARRILNEQLPGLKRWAVSV